MTKFAKTKPLKISLTVVLCALSLCLCAQNQTPKNDHHLFFEWAGIGGKASLNYEYLVKRENNFGYGFRLGFGTINLSDFNDSFNPDLLIPAGITMVYGKNHQIESGLGITASSTPVYNKDEGALRQLAFFQHLRLGYRYRQARGGFCFRIAYNPVFVIGSRFSHMYGISVGYVF